MYTPDNWELRMSFQELFWQWWWATSLCQALKRSDSLLSPILSSPIMIRPSLARLRATHCRFRSATNPSPNFPPGREVERMTNSLHWGSQCLYQSIVQDLFKDVSLFIKVGQNKDFGLRALIFKSWTSRPMATMYSGLKRLLFSRPSISPQGALLSHHLRVDHRRIRCWWTRRCLDAFAIRYCLRRSISGTPVFFSRSKRDILSDS